MVERIQYPPYPNYNFIKSFFLISNLWNILLRSKIHTLKANICKTWVSENVHTHNQTWSYVYKLKELVVSEYAFQIVAYFNFENISEKNNTCIPEVFFSIIKNYFVSFCIIALHSLEILVLAM